jgi:hypothetical protein
MRLKYIPLILCAGLLCLAAAGQTPPPIKILPPAFSGWEHAGTASTSADPAAADPRRPDLLKEAGLAEFERATYQRQGRQLKLTALRFRDATGAFAAYSGLKDPAMAEEKFCNHAASAGNRVLIACTDLVVIADFDRVTAMAPSELRTLISLLPKASGTAALPANAPLYLPKGAREDVRFALGPAGLANAGTPLSAEVIDFSKGAEVAVGHFSSVDGAATLTLIKYPTFALATERQKAVDAFGKTLPAPGPDASQLNSFYTRRVGPIVAVVSGVITEADARAIAEKIPYDVEITANEPGYTPKDNIGNLIVNILYLSFIIIGFTFVTGLAFGGFRILARRFFPGRFVDRPEQVDFIKLDLRD